MTRPFGSNTYRQLKLATRRQIKAAGGLSMAAARTRVGKTELGNYQSLHNNDRFVPVDVALDLMAGSRKTILLEALAALVDCAVMPIQAGGDGLGGDMVSFGEYASATFRDYAAMRTGGVSDPRKLEQLDRDLEEVVRVAMHARSKLRTIHPASHASHATGHRPHRG